MEKGTLTAPGPTLPGPPCTPAPTLMPTSPRGYHGRVSQACGPTPMEGGLRTPQPRGTWGRGRSRQPPDHKPAGEVHQPCCSPGLHPPGDASAPAGGVPGGAGGGRQPEEVLAGSTPLQNLVLPTHTQTLSLLTALGTSPLWPKLWPWALQFPTQHLLVPVLQPRVPASLRAPHQPQGSPLPRSSSPAPSTTPVHPALQVPQMGVGGCSPPQTHGEARRDTQGQAGGCASRRCCATAQRSSVPPPAPR